MFKQVLKESFELRTSEKQRDILNDKQMIVLTEAKFGEMKK